MPKRPSYFELLASLLLLFSAEVRSAEAQVNITLPQANIQGGTAYASTMPSGTYNSTLSLAPTISLKGSSPILLQVATGNSFPVSNLGIQLASINGVNLLGSGTPIQLTSSAQTIYSSTLSISSGTIQMTYTIPVTGYAWVAGTYTSTLTSALGGIGIATITGPGLLTLTIPAYISVPATQSAITLSVNNLNYFSTQTVTASSSFASSSTVPMNINVNGTQANFTYSNTLGLSTPSLLTLPNVQASLNSGSAIALSSVATSLTATPIAVSGGNNQMQTLQFSIPPANLLNEFVQTGTYTVPITLTTSDARSSPTVANQTTTSSLTVNVADMQAFSVNDAVTTITLSTVSDYTGVSQAQPSHVTVSSTSPWGISVKSSGSNLTNGASSIPVSYISLGNTSGQTLLSPITLSTAAQSITASQAPVISKTVGVNYSISTANANQLIGLSSGTYTTTVTYTLSAL